ncbi:hypothetical protein FQN50_006451, partial [Emmonsiellopsis sp. PD_5]
MFTPDPVIVQASRLTECQQDAGGWSHSSPPPPSRPLEAEHLGQPGDHQAQPVLDGALALGELRTGIHEPISREKGISAVGVREHEKGNPEDCKTSSVPIFSFNGKDNQQLPYKPNNDTVSSPEAPSPNRVIKRCNKFQGYIWLLLDNFSIGISFPRPKVSTFKLPADGTVYFAESWRFFNAIQDDNFSKADFLLGRGVGTKLKDQTGQNPLGKAVQDRRLKIVRNLIMHGANVHARDWDSKTAFRLAVEIPNAGTIGFLLQQDANIDLLRGVPS